jgi:hypothetical protein
MRTFGILTFLALGACSSAPAIVMQNPKTGEVAQCGQDQNRIGNQTSELCAKAYERGGWVRL